MSAIGKNARLDEDKALEKALAELRARPAPLGLKGRILASAGEARKGVVMTPRMWSVAVVCLVAIVSALAADTLVARSQMNRIQALVSRPPAPAPSAEELASLLAELGAGGVDTKAFSGETSLLARSLLGRMGPDLESGVSVHDFLKKLEGWNDDEGTENPR